MSAYDYETAKEIAAKDYPFYAILMALYMKADDDNMRKLERMWPETTHEARQRYNARGGILPSDNRLPRDAE